MYKLEKPLYHGTSKASALCVVGGDAFNAPLYLTEHKESAIHYAKCATAYLEYTAQRDGKVLWADGYAVLTFTSLPNKDYLVKDDYNQDAEPDQFKYLRPIRGLRHFTVDYQPFAYNEREHLHLVTFCIGMWRK